ncbi:MAG: sigma-70 family RNA polymerase sigma factor [Ruminococcus sp.]|nr:sigma-70 family RNA polymerase sigma factor [Ruminococcus sp.]
MTEKAKMSERLVTEFTENYVEKIFYYCLKKTGNNTNAEDLTQDIALNIIVSLTKGVIPTNFSAWVWKIVRNRYSVWADQKHRKANFVTAYDIGDYEIADENANILDKMIDSEQLSLLRRELAFITSDYRNIVLAYYLEDKSVRNIASDFSLSESTVKQRLFRARKIMKEGMNMAREFGVRSYRPEEIEFTNNCSNPGDKNQPYSIMEHMLYKNIFLEAYGNPSSAEELSLELGVALPYMENELEYLTRETFLIKNGNKYQTSFPIISRTVREQAHIAQLTAAPNITKALTSFTDALNAAFKSTGYAYYGTYQDYESAKWSLLMLAYDHFIHKNPRIRDWSERPDNGRWDMVGYQHSDVTEPHFVGKHGSNYGFRQFKYEFDGIAERTPLYLADDEAKTLCNSVIGNINDINSDTIKALKNYGYLRKDGENYIPNFLVLDINEIKQAVKKFDEATFFELSALADTAKAQLKDLYDKIAEVIKDDLPAIFSKDEYQYRLAVSNIYFCRGYVISEALRSGWLMSADKVSPAIGAHMYL